eukprot:6181693-Pleurochrysis_carterae.AAC.1
MGARSATQIEVITSSSASLPWHLASILGLRSKCGVALTEHRVPPRSQSESSSGSVAVAPDRHTQKIGIAAKL